MPAKRHYRTTATTISITTTTKVTTTVTERINTMLTLQSDVLQYALVPLTFSDQNGERVLPAGSLKATVVSGEGSVEIVETTVDGVLTFTLKAVPGATPGVSRFQVVDNTPEGDNIRVNTLEVEYTTTSETGVDIIPGTPEFRPKSELPPVTPPAP